jgi:hypothetical protein
MRASATRPATPSPKATVPGTRTSTLLALAAGAGVGRPQLDRRRFQQPRGRLHDVTEHVVHHERFADELLDLRELAQVLGPARGVGVDARVPDGEGGLPRQPAQPADLLVGEPPLAPVVDDQRAVHPSLRPQRGGRHRLEALALDLGPALGTEPRPRIGEDVGRAHGAGFHDRAAGGTAARRDGARRGVLPAQPAGGAQHREAGILTVPRQHERRVRPHDLQRLVDDGVEHLVEVQRRRERLADGGDRAHERRALAPLGDVAVQADNAPHAAGAVEPRPVARLDPGLTGAMRSRAAHLGRGPLARARAQQPRVQSRLAQRLQRFLGGPPHGGPWGEAGEPFHGRIPGDDRQTGIGDDNRVVQPVDEAMSEVVHGTRRV